MLKSESRAVTFRGRMDSVDRKDVTRTHQEPPQMHGTDLFFSQIHYDLAASWLKFQFYSWLCFVKINLTADVTSYHQQDVLKHHFSSIGYS